MSRRGLILSPFEDYPFFALVHVGARHAVPLLLTIGILSTSACTNDPSNAAPSERSSKEAQAPKQVTAVPVRTIALDRTVAVLGSLAASDQATLSVKVPGRLQTLAVDLGSVVESGQTVARIEQRDYQLRLDQAQAALAQARALLGLPLQGTDTRVDVEKTGIVRQARATLEEAIKKRDRLQTLVGKGFIAQAEFDAADAATTVARSRYQEAQEEVRNRQAVLMQRQVEVALARQQLADTAVVAPFAGIVQERRAHVGEYLAAGTPVVTMVRMNPLRLRVEIPEREALSVHVGHTVRLAIEGATHTYTGQIMRLSPTLNEQNRMLVAEADVPNPGSLRPGMFVRADIIIEANSPALTVPAEALVTFAGINKVFVVRDGKAVEAPVTVGQRTDEWIEVATGVAAGDLVVLKPGNLGIGDRVQVTGDRTGDR